MKLLKAAVNAAHPSRVAIARPSPCLQSLSTAQGASQARVPSGWAVGPLRQSEPARRAHRQDPRSC